MRGTSLVRIRLIGLGSCLIGHNAFVLAEAVRAGHVSGNMGWAYSPKAYDSLNYRVTHFGTVVLPDSGYETSDEPDAVVNHTIDYLTQGTKVLAFPDGFGAIGMATMLTGIHLSSMTGSIGSQGFN